MGSLFRPSYTAADGTRKRSAVWWLKFKAQGRVIRESSGTDDRRQAARTLKVKEGAAEEGRPIIPRTDKITIGDLFDTLVEEYTSNGRRSLDRLQVSLTHLRPAFEQERAVRLTSAEVITYTTARQQAGAANASVNRELAALKRAYRLALKGDRLPRVPYIPMLAEHNTRTGFFSRAEFLAIRSRLAPELRGLITVAYLTGWRIPSELQPLRWSQIDFKAGTLRLEPGTTKNTEARLIVMTAELREALEGQRAGRRIVPWVFHRRGKPIKDFRTAWRLACEKAGVPGRIPHDFRRTAVRNLERASVPRSVAMKMVGHKTEAVYRRYAIVDEGSLRDAAAKLDAVRESGNGSSDLGKVLGKVAQANGSEVS
jgi:integrase